MTLDDGGLLFSTSDFSPQSGGFARYSVSVTKGLAKYFTKILGVVARQKMLEEENQGQEF